jgi:cytoskeletal protein RodZ
MLRRTVAGAIVGLVAIAGAGVTGCSSDKKKEAAKDVTVGDCKADPGGGRPTASGTITNHSSKDSAYAFRVEFDDASGNSVSEGAVTVAKVAHGADASWKATGARSAKGDVTCKVKDVTRTAVP